VLSLTAVPASAQPSASGYRDDPPLQCDPLPGWHLDPSSGQFLPRLSYQFLPVPGDPTAYTRCVNGAPAGIGHCPAGFTFNAGPTGLCGTQQGAALSVDNISQHPFDPLCLGCPAPPVDVTVTYSATNLDNLNLDKVGIRAGLLNTSLRFASSDIALTADGQPHTIVLTVGGPIERPLQPGDQVPVDAWLWYARPAPADPDADPDLIAASTSRTFTVPTPPT